jgi:hypothetical protein
MCAFDDAEDNPEHGQQIAALLKAVTAIVSSVSRPAVKSSTMAIRSKTLGRLNQ